MTDEIRQIIELQEAHMKIKDLSRKVDDLTAQMVRMETEISELETDIVSRKEKEKEFEVKLHGFKTEIEAQQELGKKYTEQSSFIKKPRELFAMNKEIDNCLKNAKLMETESKKVEKELSDFRAETSSLSEKRKTKQEELDIIRTNNTSIIEKNKKEIEGHTGSMETLKRTISRELMDQYDFISASKQGIALAAVIDEACGQCYITLPPQLINEIKRGDHVIRCPSCSRILYIK